MNKIYEQLQFSFRRMRNIWADTICSNFLDIRTPSMGVATVRAVQVDNTLNPGTSIEYGRSYILTDVSNLHANFIVPADVADNDIVTWTGRFFTITMKAADATAKGLIVKTHVTSTDEEYVFAGSAWAVASGLDTAADQTITGSWSFALNDGVPQLLTTDDPGLANATYVFMVGDNILSPNIRYDMRRLIIDSQNNIDGGYYAYCDLITKENAATIIAQNGGNLANVAVSASASGETEAYITGDMVTIDGMQKHLGYKTGTLAMPPANLIIGEVWADTTDSAVHPIYRISTVNT